jgi:Ca2+ transporting ATPase
MLNGKGEDKKEELMADYAALGGLAGIAKGLECDVENGITAASIKERIDVYGANVLPKEKPVTFWGLVKDAFSDHTIILLCIAAVVSIVVDMTTPDPDTGHVELDKGWIEGFAIIVSVIIVVSATTINDYNKEKKFQQLTEMGEKVDIVVRRDGRDVTVDISDLVVGDMCLLTSGLVTPCDGILVKGQSVVIDESSATGENDPKKKSPAAPFIKSSTTVCTAENGWMLCSAVGVSSFGGRLLVAAMGAKEGDDDDEKRLTPLQMKLNDMAEDIGKIGLTVALTLFIALSIIEIVQFATGDPDAAGVDFLTYFIIAVSVVVVAVPEGLPLSVTIALAYSQSQMMADNNQVRRLAACETMGNATQICSDKTGTLTQNMMSVKQVFGCGAHTAVPNPGACLVEAMMDGMSPAMERLLCESISYNSSSEKVLADVEGTKKWQWRKDMGNKTENGMLDFVDRVLLKESPDVNTKLPHQMLRAQTKGNTFLFPFTSSRKRMSTLVRDPASNQWTVQHVKGASEKVLELCDSFYDKDGGVQPMTDAARKEIEGRINDFARDANRTIGVAVKTGLSLPGGSEPDVEPEVPLTWLAVVGIQDPLRQEVKVAVKRCQEAGVVVRMCTGDNVETAVAISKECGIFTEGKNIALTGAQFREIVYRKDTPEFKEKKELENTLTNMTVMARCQPLDKQLLVLMLMMQGEVVAVTGDGTNDAPALKLANIGFVMKSGTDVAVKAADIVLLDDNFRSVQRAVVWGRTVNDNIRKFLQFQLAVNVVCVALTFVGSLSAEGKFPLKAVQLLWVNLMMDTFAALSLSTELPSEECLTRGPIHRKAPIISRRMWRFIIVQSIYQLAVTIMFLHKAHDWFWVSAQRITKDGKVTFKHKFNIEHMTMVFNVFVMMVIFNEFNARKLYDEKNIFEGMFRSPIFVIIVIIMCGFQIFAVEVTGDFMKTQPLSWQQWLICVVFGFGTWPVNFIARLIPINEPKFSNVFELDELEPEAKKFYEELQQQIEKEQEERKLAKAAASDAARGRWKNAGSKVKLQNTVVGAIRRAKVQQNLKTSSAYTDYSKLKDAHPSAY